MWQRVKEIYVNDEKIGHLTLYWDKENAPPFYAIIELTSINKLRNIKREKGAVQGFSLECPVFKILAESSTELDNKIDAKLTAVFVDGYELKYR